MTMIQIFPASSRHHADFGWLVSNLSFSFADYYDPKTTSETNPMSGFDKARFSKEFGIEDRYVVMALVTIGKGVKEGHPTTRLPVEKVTFWYNK